MARPVRTVEIDEIIDFARLVEDVRVSRRAVVLTRDEEELAVVAPLATPSRRRRKRARTDDDRRASIAAAGSWSDFDADAFLRSNADSRARSIRDPVDL